MFTRLTRMRPGAGFTGLALVAILGTSVAMAAAQPGPGRWRGGPGGPADGRGGAALHIGELRGLDLSDAQREQVRGIVASHRDETRAVHERQRTAMRALEEAARGTDEAAIRQQAEAVGVVMADAAVLRSRVRAEVWAVLTPDQQARAEQLRAERETRMRERQARMEQRRQQRQQQRGAARPQG